MKMLLLFTSCLLWAGCAAVRGGGGPDHRDHRVEVLMAPGWGNGALAVARVKAVAERLGQSVEVRGIDVAADRPQPLGFLGSPTVLVDGRDLEPAARLRKGSGFGWRIYPDPSSDSPGVPSDAMIAAALLEWRAARPERDTGVHSVQSTRFEPRAMMEPSAPGSG